VVLLSVWGIYCGWGGEPCVGGVARCGSVMLLVPQSLWLLGGGVGDSLLVGWWVGVRWLPAWCGLFWCGVFDRLGGSVSLGGLFGVLWFVRVA